MKDAPKKLTADGLPKDGKDWTVADWATLFHALEKAKRVIAERHRPKESETHERTQKPA